LLFGQRHTWSWRAYRYLVSARNSTKYFTIVVLLGAATCLHYRLGLEFSSSFLYLVPVAYAGWIVHVNAGFVAAILSAVLWWAVETARISPPVQPLVPAGNASVRLVFFMLGAGLIHTIRQAERWLVGEVTRRTRSLHQESVSRRRLERRLMEVTAREQVRLAQDLHDGLGQYVAALALHARVLRDDLRSVQSPHLDRADRLVELVRTTNQTLRHLDRAMRVPADNASGFEEAVRMHVDEFQKLTGIACEVQLVEPSVPLEQFQALMLFRIIQEALNNAAKHGSPSAIIVSTSIKNGALQASVADNGRGLSQLQPPSRDPGEGGRIMKLRAELVGGTLSIRSGEAGGVLVECVLPLSSAPIPGAQKSS